jgi:hypothetical protein
VQDTNTIGQWDGGCNIALPQQVELPHGDRALPYTGLVYPHKYPRGAWGYDVGLAVWPKGRLVALEAKDEGEFTTVAFIPPGKRLKINAVTERAGSILVEACDVDAKPLAGRSLKEATPIVGDQFRTPVKWGSVEDLGLKEGEADVLHVKLNKAKLFGFDFE